MEEHYTPLDERQQAEAKEKLLHIVIEERGPHYLSRLETRLKIEHFKLRHLIERASPYIELAKVTQGVHGKIEAEVRVTDEGRYFSKYSGGFLAQYHATRVVEKKETQKKRASLLFPVLTLIFGGLAAWGAVENKIHDRKELQLETKIENQATTIAELKKEIYNAHSKLQTIPDSIKEKYMPQD